MKCEYFLVHINLTVGSSHISIQLSNTYRTCTLLCLEKNENWYYQVCSIINIKDIVNKVSKISREIERRRGEVAKNLVICGIHMCHVSKTA